MRYAAEYQFQIENEMKDSLLFTKIQVKYSFRWNIGKSIISDSDCHFKYVASLKSQLQFDFPSARKYLEIS